MDDLFQFPSTESTTHLVEFELIPVEPWQHEFLLEFEMNRPKFSIKQILFLTAWLAFLTALAVHIHSGSREDVFAAHQTARAGVTFLMILAFTNLAIDPTNSFYRGQAVVYGVFCLSSVMPDTLTLFFVERISRATEANLSQSIGNFHQIARIIDFGMVPILAMGIGFFAQYRANHTISSVDS